MIYSLDELKARWQKRKDNGSVHLLEDYKLQGIPKVGKKYNAYDDGKITPSREYVVEVVQLFNYGALPEDVKEQWQQKVLNCYWLYAPESDYFLKAINAEGVTEWFVRTTYGGWFSFSEQIFTYGRLDTDGGLYKIAHSRAF